MNIKFIVNDYLIAWNLLFTKSITQELCNTKQKLWNTYKKEYNNSYNDKKIIIDDYKNFIPNNDIVYNALFEKEDFKIIKKEAEKLRMNSMKLWDKNIKEIDNLLHNIIRLNINDYNCFIINKEFNIIDAVNKDSLIVGLDNKNINKFLVDLLYKIIENEVEIEEEDNLNIKKAILEMAIKNEFATILNNRSCYKDGTESLFRIKRQVYPYWLMYLGVQKEDMIKYIMRDKIAFEVNNFAYEKELININIEEFIEFIIRNKRYIIRTS